MANNQCEGCGQFAGKNHVCPRRSGILYAEMKEKSLDRREAFEEARARRLEAEETAARVSRAQDHISTTTEPTRPEPTRPEWWPTETRTPEHGEERLEPSGLTVVASVRDDWGTPAARWMLQNGELHSETGPAYVSNEKIEYRINGTLHRTDGPAVITNTGRQEWWMAGKKHRTDGPAVITGGGGEEWWVEGRLHREDGPAFITSDGGTAYYLEGREVNGLPYNEIVGNWFERFRNRREKKRQEKEAAKYGR